MIVYDGVGKLIIDFPTHHYHTIYNSIVLSLKIAGGLFLPKDTKEPPKNVLPLLSIAISRKRPSLVRITLTIKPNFDWSDRWSGLGELSHGRAFGSDGSVSRSF